MKSPNRTSPLILAASAALVFLAGGLNSCGVQRPVSAMVESGDRAQVRGDLEKAEAEYLAAIEKRPGNTPARLALGQLYLDTGRPELARAQFEVYRTLRPTDTKVLDLLAQAMLDAGDTGSLTTFVTERARDTGEAVDWVRAGDWLAQAGDADAAILAYRTAARVDGGRSPSVQKRIAEFHQSLGDNAAALRRYRMALYLDPNDEETRAAIRALGEIPGPTIGLIPTEMRPPSEPRD